MAGNNPTLYAYVHNPNSWIDVFGLDCNENRRIAKELSEPEVRKRLEKKYPKDQDFEILTEPRIYLNDGSGKFTKPDFMVIDNKGRVVDLVDAKNGGAGFTDFQNALNTHGGTFNGSSRSRKLGKGTTTTIQPNSLRAERTNFSATDLK